MCVAPGFSPVAVLKALLNRFWDDFREVKERIPFGHLFEDGNDIHILVRFFVHPV